MQILNRIGDENCLHFELKHTSMYSSFFLCSKFSGSTNDIIF